MSGVPLPIALPIALDPEAAKAGAVEGLAVSQKGLNALLDAPGNVPKIKRKASAYSRKYKAAFKKVSPTYKKKNGQWKTNGFRSAVRAAHRMAKK